MTSRADLQDMADRYLDGDIPLSDWQELMARHGENLRLEVVRAEKIRDQLRGLPRPAMPSDLAARIVQGAKSGRTIGGAAWFWKFGSQIGLAAALLIGIAITLVSMQSLREEREGRLERSYDAYVATEESDDVSSRRREAEQNKGMRGADDDKDSLEKSHLRELAAKAAKPEKKADGNAAAEGLEKQKFDQPADKDRGLARQEAPIAVLRGAEQAPAESADEANQDGETLALGDVDSNAGRLTAPAAPPATESPAVAAKPAQKPAATDALDAKELADLEERARAFAGEPKAKEEKRKDTAPLRDKVAVPGPLGLQLAWTAELKNRPGGAKAGGGNALSAPAAPAARSLDVTLLNRTVSDLTIAPGTLMLRAYDANDKQIWSMPANAEAISVPAGKTVHVPVTLNVSTPLPPGVVKLIATRDSDHSTPLPLGK